MSACLRDNWAFAPEVSNEGWGLWYNTAYCDAVLHFMTKFEFSPLQYFSKPKDPIRSWSWCSMCIVDPRAVCPCGKGVELEHGSSPRVNAEIDAQNTNDVEHKTCFCLQRKQHKNESLTRFFKSDIFSLKVKVQPK